MWVPYGHLPSGSSYLFIQHKDKHDIEVSHCSPREREAAIVPLGQNSGSKALSLEAEVETVCFCSDCVVLQELSCLTLSVFLQMTEGRLCQVHLLDGRKLELLVQVLDIFCLHP